MLISASLILISSLALFQAPFWDPSTMPSSSRERLRRQRRCRCSTHKLCHIALLFLLTLLHAQGLDVSQWCHVCPDASCAVLHQAVIFIYFCGCSSAIHNLFLLCRSYGLLAPLYLRQLGIICNVACRYCFHFCNQLICSNWSTRLFSVTHVLEGLVCSHV